MVPAVSEAKQTEDRGIKEKDKVQREFVFSTD